MITVATVSTQEGIGLVANDGDQEMRILLPLQLIDKTVTVKGLALHLINMLKPFTADELPLHKPVPLKEEPKDADSTSQ